MAIIPSQDSSLPALAVGPKKTTAAPQAEKPVRAVQAEKIEQVDHLETSLRPQTLAGYLGQEELKQSLSIGVQAPKNAVSPLTICCFMARRVWGRPPFQC